MLINYVFIVIEYKVWKNDNSDIYSINVIDEKWIVVPLDNIDYKKIENDLINGNLKTEDLGKFQIEIYETTKRYQDEIELHNSETRSFIKLNSKKLRYKREEIEDLKCKLTESEIQYKLLKQQQQTKSNNSTIKRKVNFSIKYLKNNRI